MFRNFVFAALALSSIQAAWCQTIQPPYSSNYTAVSLGTLPLPHPYGSLAFLNPSTLLVTAPVESSTSTIYQVPVTRGAGGHITGLGTPVFYAAQAGIEDGLAFGPGGVLFARGGSGVVYEFKPGSTSPDLTVDLGTYGYAGSNGPLRFVPSGFPGAGDLKVADYFSGGWYDVTLAQNGSGTYNVTGVVASTDTGTYSNMGIFYVPLGSPQFGSPSVLVDLQAADVTEAYTVDSDGNPNSSGTNFFTISGEATCYGSVFDPITGDMVLTSAGSPVGVYEVQGFSSGALAASAGAMQSAIIGQPFGSPLTVLLSDPYGAPIPGVTVSFAAPASGASATLSATTAVTGADGTASVTATANATVGAYSVTATAYGFSATFSLANVTLKSVTTAPASVVGGKSTTRNTVRLTGTAPAGGAIVALTSSDPAVATVPTSVTVSGGSAVSSPFTITTTGVSTVTGVTIKASLGSKHKTASLSVEPVALAGVKVAPSMVLGGRSTTRNTVTLDGPAPVGGAAVTLTSGDPSVASVPAAVTVAGGATSATFTITTTAVATDTVVPITATFGGVSKMANLTVEP